MADSNARADSTRAADGVSNQERDAKIERLLLTGLDHYFAAQYQEAINVWTRALFLDRSHARARAYIERARGALAERQRECEELLQSGVQAFERGQGSEARRLLKDALDSGAPSYEALSLLDRLDRIEQASPAGLSPLAPGSTVPGPAQSLSASSMPSSPLVSGLTGRIGAVGFLIISLVSIVAILGFMRLDSVTTREPVASPIPDRTVALPLPRRAERALARAETLAAGGRLREALVELEQIRGTDTENTEADLLRSRLQRQILMIEAGSPGDRRATR